MTTSPVGFAAAHGSAPFEREPAVASGESSGLVGVGGVFGVIYADPPWRYDNGGAQGGVDVQYPTMSDAEICALKVPADKNCVLYLWATMPRLPAAMDVIKAWDFDYKTGAAWDKERLGIGYWFRGQHELLLVGVRGKVSPPPAEHRIRSVIRSPIGRHSAKPDYVRDQIAKWFPNVRRLEMFCRLKRPGWEVFGNQVEHDLLSFAGGGGAEPVREDEQRHEGKVPNTVFGRTAGTPP